jgi:RNA polymerase sigma-70 factor (ECF subfamily)
MNERDPDRHLVEGLRRGDTRALEALIQRYTGEIYSLISLILGGLGSPQDAEELTSDLFVVAWQEHDEYDAQRAPFAHWLRMRAKYLALDRRRRLKRELARTTTELPEETPTSSLTPPVAWASVAAGSAVESRSVEEVVEQEERRQVLHRALVSLPELDRQIIYRRYFRGEAVADIAASTGLTGRAVENRLWRTRTALRAILVIQEGQV